jgi:hypothetical protein
MTTLMYEELSRLETEIAADEQARVGVKTTQEMIDNYMAKSRRRDGLKAERDYIEQLERTDRRRCPKLTDETYRRLLEAGRRDALIMADMDSRKNGITQEIQEAKNSDIYKTF